jgi:hypothetical protein
MLVIGVETGEISPERVQWTGRRHDDDGAESTGAATPQGLFDAVFAALHDGEQVAIGFDCSLTVPADDLGSTDAELIVARARDLPVGPGIDQLRRLVKELGTWRPWTIVTTSLPRWRATTSVLLWQADAAPGAEHTAASAIDAFYATIRRGDQPGAGGDDEALINLAAAAALDSDVTADHAELTRPALRIPVESQVLARH